MNKENNKKIKVVSLFSGCGGGDLGLVGGFSFLGKKYTKLGYELLWANDVLDFAIETHKKNFNGQAVLGDITKINHKEIPDHDILVGGFPCQSFSIVGKRGGLNDPRGKLYLEMLRILREKMPKVFIAENVKGLASIDKGNVLRQMVEDFENAGYIVTYSILNASLYGVPQKRERVFIIGVRNDLGKKFVFPQAPNIVVPLSKVIEAHDKVDSKYYFSQKAMDGLKKANKAFNKGRAQKLDAPCNTISTHLAKVSLNGTDPVILVRQNCYRRLTPLEASRIQSFPENFAFEGTDAKKYIQIGNAIPPVLMWHVANAIKTQVFSKKIVKKVQKQKFETREIKYKFSGKEIERAIKV